MFITAQGKTRVYSSIHTKVCIKLQLDQKTQTHKGPFKYYVIKELGGWGQKMAIFDDLQSCKSSRRWLGRPKKVKNMMT